MSNEGEIRVLLVPPLCQLVGCCHDHFFIRGLSECPRIIISLSSVNNGPQILQEAFPIIFASVAFVGIVKSVCMESLFEIYKVKKLPPHVLRR